MNGLNTLLQSSLIGTEKLPLNIDALPAEIRNIVATKKDDAEELVLRTAALLFVYNQTGSLPKKLADNNFEKIVEVKTITTAKATQILQAIETTGFYEKEYLYNQWLNKIIGRNEIVTANFIMPLINAGIGFNKITKSKIIQAIGETGKLIVPLKPDFKAKGLQLGVKDNVWKEGNSNERKLFLEEFFQSNANEAFALIEKDWELESITFKKSILEIIIGSTSEKAYIFLEKLYKEEFAFTATEKITVTQCRNLIANALLFNEQSELYLKTKERIIAYCDVVKKGLLGKLISGNSKVKINLPIEKDAFFSGENLKATYGIDTVNNNPAYFVNDILYWFSELLAIVPLQIWMQIFDTSEKEVFHYFLENEQYKATIHGQKENIFYNAIKENLTFSKNEQLIMQMLSLPQKNINYELAAYLSAANFEAFAVKNDMLLESNFMYYYEKENGEWTVEFSIKVLKEQYVAMVEKQQGCNDTLRNMICKFTNEAAKPILNTLFLKNDVSTFKENWIEQIYKPTIKAIEIKEAIKQL